MIARYARLEATLIVLIGALATAAVAWAAGWWALIPGVLAFALLSFYRDPPRRVPTGDNLVLAPADGRIVAMEGVSDAGADALRIRIFLSVCNVHLNRSPCRGRVMDVSYRPGRFLNALRSDADDVNECNAVTIAPAEPLPGPIRVRQIAGVLARRIVCTARVGDELAAGERFGMIKLGSRTELTVPARDAWRVCVRVGQSVRAGKTVLLQLRPDHEAGVPAALEPPTPERRTAADPTKPDVPGERSR